MAPFALPVPAYRLGIPSHTGKRKKTNDDQENEENALSEFEWGTQSSRLPSEAINPLSYSPDTLRQFAVAGLSPEDEVPSSTHPLFPHKPIPSKSRRRKARASDRIADASGAESEDGRDVASRQDRNVTVKQLSERLKHLSTLTAIMHCCLRDGDIARAKRAFGLLMQTKEVDIKHGGLWAVGSEILMRDGEAERQQRQLTQEQIADEENRDRLDDENIGNEREDMRRWGSAANVDKVRSYFESLIQQYPYDAHRPHLTSALDFWPGLFGIEIYNLDAELRQALRRLQATPAEDEAEYSEDGGGRHGYEYGEDEEMAYSEEAFQARRRQRDEERQGTARAARDEIRLQTRDAAERVAGRMDQIMENNPFATHRELLRLRGNLALFIGDLCLPSRLIDHDYHEDGEAGEYVENRMGNPSFSKIEDVLKSRAKSTEEREALAMRREEHQKARTLFQKIMDGGGEVDDWIARFVRADEEDEQHDVGLEDGW